MFHKFSITLILATSLAAVPINMKLPFGSCEAATDRGRYRLTNYLKCRSEIKIFCSTSENIKKCTEDESIRCAKKECQVSYEESSK